MNEEIEILNRIENGAFDKDKKSVIDLKDIQYLQETSKMIYMDESIKRYIVNIIYATRHPEN